MTGGRGRRSVVVKKFGGTSVADVGRIQHVARLIVEHRESHSHEDVVVVLSAMAGETNKLVAMARSCSANPDPREMDVLLATGEQVSISLLAMTLRDLGCPAKSLLGLQAEITTDTRHTQAQIEQIRGGRVREVLESGMVPVVAGFQGIDPSGDVTTLGRGGSDITAVALATALEARACYIYTDVAGVYSTNPAICDKARLLDRVCHEEMLEMASLGAKVLHPRSVYFAMRYQVPLVVLSSFEPGSGTWIVKEEELVEKPVVTGITYRTDEAKITISRLPKGSRAFGVLFGKLAEEGIFVDMITQTWVEDDSTDLSFTVPDESSGRALELAQGVVPTLEARGAFLERDIAKVSVVGIGMKYHAGVAASMFMALGNENIDVEMVSTSEVKISVVIPRKYCEMAVRTLHEAFVEMGPEVSLEV